MSSTSNKWILKGTFLTPEIVIYKVIFEHGANLQLVFTFFDKAKAAHILSQVMILKFMNN